MYEAKLNQWGSEGDEKCAKRIQFCVGVHDLHTTSKRELPTKRNIR